MPPWPLKPPDNRDTWHQRTGGKLQGWGLAAGGQDGVVRVLEILDEEIRVSMGLLGVASVDQLNTSYLRPAHPTTLPHEMSAWVNLPGNRLV
jgi:FMN-dependent dehydrogenase